MHQIKKTGQTTSRGDKGLNRIIEGCTIGQDQPGKRSGRVGQCWGRGAAFLLKAAQGSSGPPSLIELILIYRNHPEGRKRPNGSKPKDQKKFDPEGSKEISLI